ncbi:PKHS1 protein, partial [Nothocercus julius]|nr:PKHS1 protein [Nothocercus julius]
QNIFSSNGEVCKHGFFIKSPPLQLLSSQNSWKRRFFILSKSSKSCYTLKYLKGQSIKGSIAVDQIINIEIGISNSDRMAVVKKMFKCPPEEVMSISTGDRSYYLIGRCRQEIEDWVTEISSICKEVKGGGCPQVTCYYSWFKKEKFSTFFSCVQEKDHSEEKNRPNSDPGTHQTEDYSLGRAFPSLVSSFWCVGSAGVTVNKNIGKIEENPLSSDTDEDIKEEEDDYYKTPSKLLAKVVNQMQLTCTSDGLLAPPKCQETNACPRDLMANRNLKLVESSTSQQSILQRKQNSLPLSVVQLAVLLSQVTDESQLQKLDIFMPLIDINSYLTLTEAAGQI